MPRLILVAVLLLAVSSFADPQSIELEECWRFGGAGCETLIGTVTEADVDRDGNVYLLDTQLAHVLVISPTGELLRTIGRPGEGPGESQNPRDVIILPDGTVGLLELFPAKLIRLSPDGEPRGTLIIGGADATEGGFTSAGRIMHRGGNFVVTGQRITQIEGGQHRDMYLAGLSEDGALLHRYSESVMTLDFNDLVFVERDLNPGCHLANAVGPAGRVYVTVAWDRYAVEVFAPGGDRLHTIERDFENRPRNEDELRRVNALYDANAANIPFPTRREVEPSPSVIANLAVDPSGRLWIQHSRSADDRAPGVMQTYDVFAPDGDFLRQVSLVCEGDPIDDGLVFLDDGRVLLIKGFAEAAMARTDLGNVPLGEEQEADPMEFVCYESPF
jgi:hypothetical protein